MNDRLRSLRVVLKAAYDAVLAEPVPQSIHDILNRELPKGSGHDAAFPEPTDKSFDALLRRIK